MAKKSKKKVRVKRYVTVTKTVVKKAKDYSSKSSSTKSSKVIGTYGGVTFEIKTDNDKLKMLTMDNVTQEVSANWAEHPIIGRRWPKAEFLNANTRTFTMTIIVDRQFGYSPHSVIYKFVKRCETGAVSPLMVGAHRIGGAKTQWYIQSVSEAWDKIYREGQLTRATLDVTLGLYR